MSTIIAASSSFLTAGRGALRLAVIASLFAVPMVMGTVIDHTPGKHSKSVGYVLMVSLQRAG